MRLWLSVMQDNAPAHTAGSTMEDMRQRLIQPIFWPANSPDLNPIEAVWNRMKDYIQRRHPNLGCGKQRTRDSFLKIVKEAWDSVSSEDLVRLTQSMPARCQAVIDADGGLTRYQGLKTFQPKVQIQG
ncbi:Bgt-51220 [Blumeria graminis f. sp. tritici]|uniref:Bgt-51220 n=1 Tax=Blumeria graminis f. sp. tritici TaxID=62690 RepID=A0A9X9QDV2_BLUGR|nr:Bgt-51220 [Blumeria graminis f. sp. tritici]